MSSMLRLVLTVLAAAACVPVSGGSDGGRACPDLACGPPYQIQFLRAGGWKPGVYRIDVTADGVTANCAINIPMSCDTGPRCSTGVTWLPAVAGCALDPGQQSIDGLIFDRTTPTTVEVTVSQADRPLGSQRFMPSYKTTEGMPGCNLSCTQAPNDHLNLEQ
jgi:hypothetical protein